MMPTTYSRYSAYWGGIMSNIVPPGSNPMPDGLTAIGYTRDRPDPNIPADTICIPGKHRHHAMVLGSTGFGKSTILKMLIRQNLIRGDGVAILDPHHDLAAWTAQRIPEWRANHLVYISPDQLKRTGKAVPINPLEPNGDSPATAATAFTETLLKAFGTDGPRMQQILTAAAVSIIASGRGGMDLLHKIILDESERDIVLADVNIQDNLLFWEKVFPKQAKDAVPAVDNKLTPIVSNPAVGPFFEGGTAFNMQKLLDNHGILVFDGAGCSNDIERTLFTTFLLTMMTTAAAKLTQSRPQNVKPKPFYLYVDEMQMIDSTKLKEMLRQVRKWGIRMTLATQQLESIDKDDAAAMLGNCSLYIVSNCTMDTAKRVAPKMGIDRPEILTKIPKFHMSFHMGVPSGDVHGSLMRTRNMDDAVIHHTTLAEIVDFSLANYGVDVDMAKYTNDPAHAYDIKPLDMGIMSVLYHNPDGLGIHDIHEAVRHFDVEKRTIAQHMEHLRRDGVVDAASRHNDTIYTLRAECINKHFDVAALKGRAGGDMHIRTIKALHDNYTRRGYYTRMDVGDTASKMADLEVCEPATGPEGNPDVQRWGNRVAIEVETGPARHPNKPGKPGQVYKNWKKSPDCIVWFLVYNERDAQHIKSQLAEMGVDHTAYNVSVISYDAILAGKSIPVPPGFRPANPLKFCEYTHAIPDILHMIPEDGLKISDIRSLNCTYGNVEMADTILHLEEDGMIYKKRGRIYRSPEAG